MTSEELVEYMLSKFKQKQITFRVGYEAVGILYGLMREMLEAAGDDVEELDLELEDVE